jgi:hypothetical protein
MDLFLDVYVAQELNYVRVSQPRPSGELFRYTLMFAVGGSEYAVFAWLKDLTFLILIIVPSASQVSGKDVHLMATSWYSFCDFRKSLLAQHIG